MKSSNQKGALRLCAVTLGLLAVGSVAHAGIGGTDLLRAAVPQGTGATDLDVLGLVQTVDAASGALVVSGQTVHVSSKTKLGQSSLPGKGSLVAVYGALNADGTIAATQITSLGNSYVPGATTLYVRGVVKSVNAALGRAQVGSLSIDYTASLYSSAAASIKAGTVAEFAGVQTSSTLFASKAAGIGGTDLVAAGIGGTDLAMAGIGGTDLVAAGIGGTDLAKAGIGGTDLVAAGIGGTDLVKAGIGGTDLVAAGIGGTDLAVKVAAGIGGTDRVVAKAAGIGGTD